MPVLTLPDPDRFKTLDAASYDLVVDQFDRFTGRFTTPLAARAVQLANLRAGDRVLDVGAGTGVVALEAALAIAPGMVTGIDLSEPMLDYARRRAEERGLTASACFRNMDAERLEFDDCSFDAVVSLFALLHFPDPLRALREMFRVLKPGGRLVVAVGSGPPLMSMRGLLHRAGRGADLWALMRGRLLLAPGHLDRTVRRLVPEGAQREESPLASAHRNRSARLPALVREAGFSEIRSSWMGLREDLPTATDFWDLQRTYSSISRKRLGGASSESYTRVRTEFFERCEKVLARGGKLAYHHAAAFAAARRPA